MKLNRPIPRRQFLERSALAASAFLGAPAIVPSSVFGAESAVTPANRPGHPPPLLGRRGQGPSRGTSRTRQTAAPAAGCGLYWPRRPHERIGFPQGVGPSHGGIARRRVSI